ncbi:MAG: chemotaxis protein CheB [Novosphingobium sp.]
MHGEQPLGPVAAHPRQENADGARGLKLMRDAGCRTFAQERASATVSVAPAAAIEAGAVEHELPLAALRDSLLVQCRSA